MKTTIAIFLLAAATAYGAIAHLDDTFIIGTGQSTSATSSALNCAGATIILLSTNTFGSSTANLTVTDSLGTNTYVFAANNQTVSNSHNGYWYVVGASVGGNAMTVTIQCQAVNCGTGGYPSASVSCWSGTATTSPFRATDGTTSVAASFSYPSGVATAAGDLVIVGHSTDSSNACTDPTSYTTLGSSGLVGGQAEGGGAAYRIAGISNPENPTWTSCTGNHGANIVSIKAGSATVTQIRHRVSAQ